MGQLALFAEVGKLIFDFTWFTVHSSIFCFKEISTTFALLNVFRKLGRGVSFGSVGTIKPRSVILVLILDGSQNIIVFVSGYIFFTIFAPFFFGKLGRAVSFGSVGTVKPRSVNFLFDFTWFTKIYCIFLQFHFWLKRNFHNFSFSECF